MQLTRFDRWLRETYAQETHIHTMREVEPKPTDFAIVRLPPKPGQRYNIKYITRSPKAAAELIKYLNENGLMFTTRIHDRTGWFQSIVAPKSKSFTWSLFSYIIIAAFTAAGSLLIHRIWSDPEIRKNILEAIDIFKG